MHCNRRAHLACSLLLYLWFYTLVTSRLVQVLQLESQLMAMRKAALAADGLPQLLAQAQREGAEAAAAAAAAQATIQSLQAQVQAAEAARVAAVAAKDAAEATARRLAKGLEEKEQQRVATTRDAQVHTTVG
jgi:hypothetical protein